MTFVAMAGEIRAGQWLELVMLVCVSWGGKNGYGRGSMLSLRDEAAMLALERACCCWGAIAALYWLPRLALQR
jgi:hypothetical protein